MKTALHNIFVETDTIFSEFLDKYFFLHYNIINVFTVTFVSDLFVLVIDACQLVTFPYSDYKVPLAALSESQLALCHPEKKLLSLVLANCHYTLEKGQQTVSSYDHEAIERELSRRFFAGKPRIQTVSLHILKRIIILVLNI